MPVCVHMNPSLCVHIQAFSVHLTRIYSTYSVFLEAILVHQGYCWLEMCATASGTSIEKAFYMT
jgi:hypothetical protein